MTSDIAAVVLADDSATLAFAGMSLLRRAALTLSRLGIERVATVDAGRRPFAAVPDAGVVVVLPATTIVQPAGLAELLRHASPAEDRATLVIDDTAAQHRFLCVTANRVSSIMSEGNASSMDIVLLSRGAAERVRGAVSLRDALRRLSVAGVLDSATAAPRFCARLLDQKEIPALERRYLRHTNGGDGEGVFTRNIRVFSIPLTRFLLRFPAVTANVVTMASLALAAATGLAFAHGGYGAGIIGALLYWGSMVCDCSDGEVARARLGDSPFGAWLETVTDYLSYFLILGGIVWGDAAAEGYCHHTRAAMVAAAASLAIVALVGYQRARTASANPGAFDDALAGELRRGTAIQRFTGWSRQLIKRSFFAHLLLFQAVIGHVRALTEIWAYGAVGALVLVLGVHLHLVRHLRVPSTEQLATVNS